MSRASLAAALLVVLCSCQPARSTEPADAGCATRDVLTATGFFHVETDCGYPRLVDPDGKPFFSFGVNHISWSGDQAMGLGTAPYNDAVRARYGTERAWAEATARRLTEWGWNTAGAWSSESMNELMPHTRILNLSQSSWTTGAIPDYFDPDWEARVKEGARRGAAGHANDRQLIGYFLDNEIHWGPDWRTNRDLLDDAMQLAATTPGKQAVVALLRDAHHADLADFNAAWGTAFTSWDELAAASDLPARGTQTKAADADRSAVISLIARRFFSVTAGAIRAADPNHLVLGVRFVAALVPREAAAAAGEFCDVVSANNYEFEFDLQDIFHARLNNFVDLRPSAGACLADLFKVSGKPVLISEFGWRAKDSGLPNTWPPIYPVLETQKDRADRFESYARACLAAPWMVGYHWFEWADEPASGRFDREDCNWGLVNIGDDPYPVVTSRTAAVNHWP